MLFSHKLLRDKVALLCLLMLAVVVAIGIFAPWLAPNDPNKINIARKYADFGARFPLGSDHLGRCVLSRLMFGVRTTLFLALLTMAITIAIGCLFGFLSGYFRGRLDEIMMRCCDVMLSFPSQIMILAIVGILGVGIFNVILANILVKWAWYTRMIRGIVIKHSQKNYILFSRASGTPLGFILRRHLLPNALAEIVVLATLDTGWVILNISALSFLGLGVQAPTAEWGTMLSEAQKVMMSHPTQMLAPGLAILVVVAAFNLLGDCLRDALDPRESHR
ncbi:nickel/cobalt ABC transporter permease [Brenneria tiliae]|uniref:nickel/cobalt ABC transporter permease n=1 Tax=Brenneria tiliae TaxID=2914984 RepID=UPI002014C6E7|nr:nickel/cobalt ABC transporter permease [Brenneria tiliae]MCL2897976.1 ABC transporter permease subunit [Brenneria tiliae]MCL2902057.1 ABC transporter permease subunit [Brenneria tiliae]